MPSSAFVEAIRKGNIAALEGYINDRPAVVKEIFGWENYQGSAVHCAAYYNQPAVIEFLVKEKGADANLQRGVNRSWTPLHHAKMANAHQAAARLLDMGADPALKNEAGENTDAFCALEKVRANRNPEFHERERQRKIEGTWTRTAPAEIVHQYQLPEQKYSLTDIFNFETRSWKAIVKDMNGNGMAQNILFFDDIPDTEIVHQAFRKLKELGGDADEDSINQKPVRGKTQPTGKIGL